MNLDLKTSFRYGMLLWVLAGSTISCNNSSKARKIVLASLEAHGGIENWRNVKELSYIKTTILFDSLGTIESKMIQNHKNVFYPSFTAEMEWKEDAINKKVVLRNDTAFIYFNDTLQNNRKLEEKYYKKISAAHYVIWQPYKLLDNDVTLTYQGKDTIDDKKVQIVKATYFNDDGSSANPWWYYFDIKTNKLVGAMVYHKPTYSFIKNTAYETTTGLSLNAQRKSYRVDSLRNIKFLRAMYTYEILKGQ